MKLNVGCGYNCPSGWENLDIRQLDGVDIVADVRSIPRPNDYYDTVRMEHVLEHIQDPLPVMQELHRVTSNGGQLTIIVPYGASNPADEDPTHVRRYYEGSWQYFSQLAYHRTDYGYRGDWRILRRRLHCNGNLSAYRNQLPELYRIIQHGRNFVIDMTVVLECVKPIRDPRSTDEVEKSPLEFTFADTRGSTCAGSPL